MPTFAPRLRGTNVGTPKPQIKIKTNANDKPEPPAAKNY